MSMKPSQKPDGLREVNHPELTELFVNENNLIAIYLS